MNVVPVYIGTVPGRCLVDSGAFRSILSGKMYRKILKRNGLRKTEIQSKTKVFSADSSSIKIEAEVESDIKIGGLSIPFTFLVIENLGYDCLIGMDFLRETGAVINIQTNSLHLYDGLTSVAMTKTGDHVIARTINSITIPPLTEIVFTVKTDKILPSGNYIIEGTSKSPCHSLLVARTLINKPQKEIPCLIMNTSDRQIKLRPKTPIGTLSAVKLCESNKQAALPKSKISIDDMRKELEAKSISFSDTALVGQDLNDLITLLYKNKDLMTNNLSEMPGTKDLYHQINTGDSPPIHKKAYRHSPQDRLEISRQVQDMLKAEIIEESFSPWSSPVLLCRKKDGTKRFVVDFRGLNSVTKLTKFPLPTIEDILDNVSSEHPTLWSSLDLKSGYFQAFLDPQTAEKTGFMTHDGNFIFKRLPMGLCGSVQFFQMLMQKVLKGMTPAKVLVYLDDILVLGKNPQDMLLKLDEVFQRFRQHNLRLHPSKCHWATARVVFLGHVFDKNGISTDPDKIKIVESFPVPDTPKRVRSYLGLVGYYRRFINNFSQISAPMRALLKKDVKFKWTTQCQDSFEKLKQSLISSPVLILPDFKRQFILTTDASFSGIAYILSQKDDSNREQVICYGGRSLHPNEINWTVSEIECLAIVEGVKHYHTYLAGSEFEIVSDHSALSFLQKMKLSENSRLTRWALFLQGYRYHISYKPGKLLTAADALSRIPRKESVPVAVSTNSLSQERTIIDFEEKITVAVLSETERSVLPNNADILSALTTCPDFSKIYAYLKHNILPADNESARRIILESEQYIVQDDMLFHMYVPRTKKLDRAYAVVKQLCIPTSLREIVTIQLHDNNAHIGFDRLFSTMKSRYFWPKMYTFLHRHVVTCLQCQHVKRQIHKTTTPILPSPIAQPCTKWYADFHGPFPASNNMKYILVFIDSSSMWPILVPTADTSAQTVVQALYDHVVTQFGLPRSISIVSDNGGAFISQLASTFCKTFNIQQYFTSPHHPQSNSRAEEFAQTIHNSLKVMVEHQSDWANHLQSVAYSYRASATTNLGLSPFEIIFGHSMNLPIDNSLLPEKNIVSPQAYSKDIKAKLDILHQIAMENVKENAERYRTLRNESAKQPVFQVGDQVLLHNPITKKGECAKLKIRYIGPYVITDVEPGYNYRLHDLTTGKAMKRAVHADRIRLIQQLDNDYRFSPRMLSHPAFYKGLTPHRGINLEVSVDDIMNSTADVLVHFIDNHLQPVGAMSESISKSFGSILTTAHTTYLKKNESLHFGDTVLLTFDQTEKVLLQVVVCDDAMSLTSDNISTLVENVLCLADTLSSQSVILPFPGIIVSDEQTWSFAHELANAICRFDATSKGSLTSLIINGLSLLSADILSFVCRHVLQPGGNAILTPDSSLPNATLPPSIITQQNDVPSFTSSPTPVSEPSDKWFEIDRVLKDRTCKGKKEYLVQWTDGSIPTWVKRGDLTDTALKQFLLSRPKRRRRR
jgi:hypothetical protein